MEKNEITLIKNTYDFLYENDYYLLKRILAEIEKKELKLPFKLDSKYRILAKNISEGIKFLCVSGAPLGLFVLKAENDERKREMLKEKRILKNRIKLYLKEPIGDDSKNILDLFLAFL